ncbi:hypothetical protein F2Q70_00034566 [Brassica cretica]|uniref:Uncharacterized protein n=2 Tax=Brassica cretica TaxID=69181 RepID=A0A8S9JP11_BRACR|nr:hypothetical protein F2Q68_00029430 [Brassica cretica]KAF2584270.1 hypothetical protein F2Q70_00034566 [Brassica cretica]KAF3528719.1 hypothetical protein DY000_02037346 [Brassica cretica]
MNLNDSHSLRNRLSVKPKSKDDLFLEKSRNPDNLPFFCSSRFGPESVIGDKVGNFKLWVAGISGKRRSG